VILLSLLLCDKMGVLGLVMQFGGFPVCVVHSLNVCRPT
jgi:hypothetical protein